MWLENSLGGNVTPREERYTAELHLRLRRGEFVGLNHALERDPLVAAIAEGFALGMAATAER